MLNSITVLSTIFLHLEDIIVTPIYFAFFLLVLHFISKRNIRSKFDRKVFFLGAVSRMLGGIFFGILYEFVFKGGDTSAYWYFGIKITDIILQHPGIGFDIFFTAGEYSGEVLRHISTIQWYDAPTEFFILRISGILGLFSFKIYSVMALFYALFSFSGSWMMYQTFTKIYPNLRKEFAISTLFIPSVVFWGGGIMKDTICIGALGWLLWAFYTGFIEKRNILKCGIIAIIMIWVIYSVKIYILFAFLPPALLWVFNENSARIKSKAARILSKPLFLAAGLAAAFIGMSQLTESSGGYDIDYVAERTKINSEYLYAVSVMEKGSAYSIGEFDGTINSMIKVIPQAINVALFRPYIFEVRNATMLLSAIEATIFLYITLSLLIRLKLFKFIKLITGTPIVTFCITFTLILAAAVGMNSFNFGTLVRYKIPFLPFYLSALYIMKYETSKYKQSLKLRPKRKAIKSFAH